MADVVKSVGSETVAPVGQGDRVVVPEFFDGEFFTPLALDSVTSAVLAFSISRKLRTAYTGSAIRVRRSSDDTDQDIGFVGGSLDTASLESFCGVGNGFVTKVYEQSGDAAAVDYAQTTAALQPQIVASGTTITKDGKVAMRQPTSGAGAEFITLSAWNTRPAAAVAIEVWSAPVTKTDVMALSVDGGDPYSLYCADGSTNTVVGSSSGASQTWSKNGLLVLTNGTSTRGDAHTEFCTGALNIARHNAIDFASGNCSTLRSEYTSLTSVDGPEYWSEQIIITDSAEVDALEANIAAAYGITLAA